MTDARGLVEQFGQIDIYLFDQLLRGRIATGMRVLDCGCGSGRNLVYLLRHGFDVWATDRDPAAVHAVRELAARCRSGLTSESLAHRFRVEPTEHLSFADASFDVVISSAVLHFASNAAHFDRMVDEMWRVLAPGGLLFARLASSIGIADRVTAVGDGRYLLPDGSERFLVDEKRLDLVASRIGAQPADPLKTTVVRDLRSMTTWVVAKPSLGVSGS